MNTEKISLKHQAKVISCFPGVGKNYAIEKLKEAGYKILSIEKEDKSFNKSMLFRNVLDNLYEYDIIFVPFYIGISKDLSSDYYTLDHPIIVFPDECCKLTYKAIYERLNFTEEQIQYIMDNWEEMILYIKDIDVTGLVKCIKLYDISRDYPYPYAPHYLLDIIDY